MGFLSRVGLQGSAIAAGVVALFVLYVIGAILVIFAYSLFSESVDASVLRFALRIGGLVALAFPAYFAARVAGQQGLRHGLALGVIAGLITVALMVFTFSWEGTLRDHVIMRMLPAFLALVGLSLAGGVVGEWQNRRDARRTA